MPTLAKTEFQAALDALVGRSSESATKLFARMDRLSRPEALAFVSDAYPETIDPFMRASSELTAQWYAEQPTAPSRPGSKVFSPEPADLPAKERIAAGGRWALTRSDPVAAVKANAGRNVRNASRRTVVSNAIREGVRWVREARPDACGFCRMLATRTTTESGLYVSERSALVVVGREIRSQRDGVTGHTGKHRRPAPPPGVVDTRQKMGESYHDHCKCDAVMVRDGVYEPPEYVQQWEDEYRAAVEKHGYDLKEIAKELDPPRKPRKAAGAAQVAAAVAGGAVAGAAAQVRRQMGSARLLAAATKRAGAGAAAGAAAGRQAGSGALNDLILRGADGVEALAQKETLELEANMRKRLGERSVAARDAGLVNPNWKPSSDPSGDDDYRYNCAYCVMGYEFRRRGFDVEAAPGRGVPSSQLPKKFRRGSENGNYANWSSIDPSLSGKSHRDAVDAYVEGWPDGARGFIGVEYSQVHGGGGHVLVVEKIDGKAVYFDPQVAGEYAKQIDAARTFDLVRPASDVMVLRTDELFFDESAADMVVNRGDDGKRRRGGGDAAAAGAELAEIAEPYDLSSEVPVEIVQDWTSLQFDSLKRNFREGARDAQRNGYSGLEDAFRKAGNLLDGVEDEEADPDALALDYLWRLPSAERSRVMGREIVAIAVHSEPTKKELFRGIRVTPEDAAQWEAGMDVSMGLSSFTSYSRVARGFAFGGDDNWKSVDVPEGETVPVIFHLEPGAKVAMLTDNGEHDELVGFGTFRVLSVEDEDGAKHVYLRQTSLVEDVTLTGVRTDSVGPDDYGMAHRPPGPDTNGVPLTDLTDGLPADVYDKPEFYISDPETRANWDVFRRVRGKPDEMVTIYRAVPPEAEPVINRGDWVTLRREYAEQHAMQSDDPAEDWPVVSMEVPAATLFTSGDSLDEFGYWGDGDTVLTGGAEDFDPMKVTAALRNDFYDWLETVPEADLPDDLDENNPLGNWRVIERFLAAKYPAAHRGFLNGQEDAAHWLDQDLDPDEWSPSMENEDDWPDEYSSADADKLGYDPQEVAAGMVLLHNRAHSGRLGSFSEKDKARLVDIFHKRVAMQRVAEKRERDVLLEGGATDWSQPRDGEGFTEWRDRLWDGLSQDGKTFDAKATGNLFRAMSDDEYRAGVESGEFKPLLGDHLYVTDDPDRLSGGSYGAKGGGHIVEFAPMPTEDIPSYYNQKLREQGVRSIPVDAVRRVWSWNGKDYVPQDDDRIGGDLILTGARPTVGDGPGSAPVSGEFGKVASRLPLGTEIKPIYKRNKDGTVKMTTPKLKDDGTWTEAKPQVDVQATWASVSDEVLDENLRQALRQAQPWAVEAGTTWYPGVRKMATRMTKHYAASFKEQHGVELSPDILGGLISVFSRNNGWIRNAVGVRQFLDDPLAESPKRDKKTGKIKMVKPMHVTMTGGAEDLIAFVKARHAAGETDDHAIVEAFFASYPTAPKPHRFWRSIMGDEDNSAIDRWMARVQLHTDDPEFAEKMRSATKTVKGVKNNYGYHRLEASIKRISREPEFAGFTATQLQAMPWVHLVGPDGVLGDIQDLSSDKAASAEAKRYVESMGWKD